MKNACSRLSMTHGPAMRKRSRLRSTPKSGTSINEGVSVETCLISPPLRRSRRADQGEVTLPKPRHAGGGQTAVRPPPPCRLLEVALHLLDRRGNSSKEGILRALNFRLAFHAPAVAVVERAILCSKEALIKDA